jgi:hypothetical protein
MSDADAPLDGLDPGPQEHRSHDDVMHDRRMLARLWNEIESLPPPQRSALLLNLRDSGGGSALSLLPATGIASIRQIAAVLGIAVETFAGLWKRLPLDDLEIASLLGVPRQKVINMRLAARQRLARRTASKNAQAGTNR